MALAVVNESERNRFKVTPPGKEKLTKMAMTSGWIHKATVAGMKGMRAGGAQQAKAIRVGSRLAQKGEVGQMGAKMIASARPKLASAGIAGGRAAGVPDSAFNPKSLKKGTKVEYEHTDRKDIAKDIAKDHLAERGDYYEKLEKMEKQAMMNAFFDELEKISSAKAKTAGLKSYVLGKAYRGGRTIGTEVRRGIRDEIATAASQHRKKLIAAAVGLPAAAATSSYVSARAGAKAGTHAAMRELETKKQEKAKVAAFLDELQKIAEISAVEHARREHAMRNEKELLKSLQPGDLIFSAPHRSNMGSGGFVGKRIFKPLSRMVQGSDYGHSAIYTGNGKIIDTRMERAAKEVALHELVAKNNVVAARPKNVTPEEQQTAIQYARSQLGKKYSFGALIRAGTPFQGKFRKGGPEDSKKLMCSGLAANAYANRKFAPVSRRFIRPSQILSSKQVTPVASLETGK